MSLKKITDLDKSLQTDELKIKVYHLIKQFVHKNQVRYHPHFRGEKEDLISGIYANFTVPKKHRNGQVFSELDRFDYEAIGTKDFDLDTKLASYVQNYVVSRLIDYERSDKREVNYDTSYDEESGNLSLDYIARIVEDEDPRVEDLHFSPRMVEKAKETYKAMSSSKKKEFLKLFEKSSDLPENIYSLISELVGSDNSKNIKEESMGELKDEI